MISYSLATKLFEGFSILRWNDRLRPMEFIEIDHHGFKSMLTYFLGSALGDELDAKGWRRVVDGCVYDFLQKISTSDIHLRVRARIKNEPSFHKFIIDDWSKSSFGLCDRFLDNFSQYLKNKPNENENSVLRFSHRYSSLYELDVISRFSNDADIDQMVEQIRNDLKSLTHDAFVKDAYALMSSDKGNWLFKIMNLASRLRHQMRWSQTPRIPMTTVLGHSMYCAVMAYFISINVEVDGQKLSDDRVVNNFYAALFHDLPEALSRDIISPIKRMSKEVEVLIKAVEEEMFEADILNYIPEKMQKNFRFITGTTPGVKNEFENRILTPYGAQIIKWGDDVYPYFEPMQEHMDEPGIDGKIVKICDQISAFMEADMSLSHGIHSPALEAGHKSIKATCIQKQAYNLKMADFFEVY